MTVVSKRTVSGDVITSVGQRAPGGSGFEGVASSAVIVSIATSGDGNARVAGRAP